ncbi:DUF697 domain-containing protein [Thiohalocapsa halophila]|uniref:DUF697 domain-containing protein n=1 Tax=Thiohalocapsa halophila TaxID=69359 RepID=UPI0019036DB0|nr:DUF697 domain-containing protein [Thiohalocapsa halophila]
MPFRDHPEADPMFVRMCHRLLKIAFWVGLLLSFLAVMEVLRAFETLHRLHPVAGYSFLGLFGLGILYLLVRYLLVVYTRPRILVPPPVGDPGAAADPLLYRYAVYLSRLCRRLSENRLLSEAWREAAVAGRARLRAAVRRGDMPALRSTVLNEETAVVRPAVAELEQRADREVRDCVRDVLLGVGLSPWRSSDLAVTVYRSTAMVLRIIRVFDNRPPLRQQLLIMKDILAVVATVNFLNFSGRLLQNLAVSVPLLGRFADDIAQGVGASLLTSVAGHTAVSRCRSFRGWDAEEARRTIARDLRVFLGDIRRIVTTDLLPEMRKPIEVRLPETAREAETFQTIREETSKAIDDTARGMGQFVRKPAPADRDMTDGRNAFGRAALREGRRFGGGIARSGIAMASMPARTWQGLRRAVVSSVASPSASQGRAGRRHRHAIQPEPTIDTAQALRPVAILEYSASATYA